MGAAPAPPPTPAEAASSRLDHGDGPRSYGTTATTIPTAAAPTDRSVRFAPPPSPPQSRFRHLAGIFVAMAADLRATTARLRRTFQYPADDSPNDHEAAGALDEEEQENLIGSLTAQNSERNAQFQKYLLALPALAAVPYLLALAHTKTALLAVLALSSLASTGYLIWQLPPDATGIPLLDAWSRPDESDGVGAGGGGSSSTGYAGVGAGQGKHARKRRRASSFSAAAIAHRSPLEAWLPVLNAGLCALLILMGLLLKRRDGTPSSVGVGIGNLPAIVYGVVLVAKMVMASVDPERELGGLRYEYKGA